ncbi:hypothetical protein CANDROIZ_260006 [Candidatus Roizmanbacteria bacterium]|nr:hypothetical protein CANDROIZ_260006 [Candidatus Roizmanbacteria bacterium]
MLLAKFNYLIFHLYPNFTQKNNLKTTAFVKKKFIKINTQILGLTHHLRIFCRIA